MLLFVDRDCVSRRVWQVVMTDPTACPGSVLSPSRVVPAGWQRAMREPSSRHTQNRRASSFTPRFSTSAERSAPLNDRTHTAHGLLKQHRSLERARRPHRAAE